MESKTTTNLGDFLASLGSGPVHSSGVFTISESEARDKLARFTLVHPSLYVLEVVSLAVCLGATFLEVTTPNDGDTRFRFDGEILTAEDCRRALGHLFESSTSDTLRSLGIALSAAQSLSSEPLTLVLAEGRFHFDGDHLHTIEGESEPSVTEIIVPGRFGFLGGLFRRDATLQETLSLCHCAPLKLTLNGTVLKQGWKPERAWEVGALLDWQHPQFPLRWGSAPVQLYSQEPSPGNFSALLAFFPSEAAQVNGFIIIRNGIAYRTRDPELALPGICGAVMMNDLDRNLSCSEIVWDQRYRAMVESLKPGLARLADVVSTSPYRMTLKTRDARSAMQWALDQRGAEDPSTAPALRSWLTTDESLLSKGTQTVLEMADQARSEGDTLRAESLELAALETLIEEFRVGKHSRDLSRILDTRWHLLESLIDKLAESPRKRNLLRFLSLLKPGREGEQDNVQHNILRFRSLGQPNDAFQLISKWQEGRYNFDFRVPSEVCLAARHPDLALTYLLQYLDCQSLAEVLDKDWPDYHSRDLDLLADLLEYEDHALAIATRELSLQSSDSFEMRYLRGLDLTRQSKAHGTMASYIKNQAVTSFYGMTKLSNSWKEIQKRAPEVDAMLKGHTQLPQSLDDVLLPLCDSLSTYSEHFPYLVSRLAHRLRLADQYVKADQVMARAYSLREMERALYGL